MEARAVDHGFKDSYSLYRLLLYYLCTEKRKRLSWRLEIVYRTPMEGRDLEEEEEKDEQEASVPARGARKDAGAPRARLLTQTAPSEKF